MQRLRKGLWREENISKTLILPLEEIVQLLYTNFFPFLVHRSIKNSLLNIFDQIFIIHVGRQSDLNLVNFERNSNTRMDWTQIERFFHFPLNF